MSEIICVPLQIYGLPSSNENAEFARELGLKVRKFDRTVLSHLTYLIIGLGRGLEQHQILGLKLLDAKITSNASKELSNEGRDDPQLLERTDCSPLHLYS